MTPVQIGLAIAVLLAVAFVLTRKGKKKKPRAPVMTSGSAPWRNHNSPGMPAAPDFPPGKVYAVAFPQAPTTIHSVQGKLNLAHASAVVMNFSVTGSGFTAPKATDGRALVSIMFQARGDNWQGVGSDANKRFFATAAVDLVAGENQELRAQLTPDKWTNAEGKSDPEAFIAALADMEWFYVTTGHSSGRAHGVHADPGSTFALNSIEAIF